VLVKRALLLLNAALATAILDLISQVHLPSFVKMLTKYLKYSTFYNLRNEKYLKKLVTFKTHVFDPKIP